MCSVVSRQIHAAPSFSFVQVGHGREQYERKVEAHLQSKTKLAPGLTLAFNFQKSFIGTLRILKKVAEHASKKPKAKVR